VACWKEKLVRTALCCVGIWATLSLPSALVAQPRESILVLQEQAGAGMGLIAALRIQLIDAVDVKLRPWSTNGPLAERIQSASALGRAERALAVVWTEPALRLPDGSREAILYVVGRREGRAILQVVRVAGGNGADLDRTLALKVSEVLAEFRHGDAAVPTGSVLQPPPTAAEAKRKPKAALPTTPASWGIVARAGARSSVALGPAGDRWGAGGALGPTLDTEQLTAALELGLEVFPSVTTARAEQQVWLREYTPGLNASGRWKLPNLALGVRTGAALALLSATGRTAQGRRNERSVSTFSWLVGIELERAVGGGFGVAANLDLQLHSLRRRFAVNDVTVADLGRAHLVLGLSLVFRTEHAAGSH
jgi:hypothetical protein